VPSPPPTPDLLTEGQRRHLSASLGHLERHLREIERLTDGRHASTAMIFTREARDLPAEFGPAVHSCIADALSSLADLAAAFDLAPRQTSDFRSVQSLVLSGIVLVEDVAPRHLVAYGPVHPDLPARLDPLLDRLHAQVREIGHALPAPPSTGDPP
jgi:hypothetical protein